MSTTTIPQVRFRTIDGVRIRYADSGGSPKPTAILTSPWPESVYVRRYPAELPVLAGLLPQIEMPVTIINGRHDRVIPLANAKFLDQRLPASRLVIIDAGHFVWEEEPAQYASAVLDSITGNWP
jgi:alpha/beta hydrolase fold